jgi:quinol monooxygenase YgiN
MHIATLRMTPSTRDKQKILGIFRAIHTRTRGSLGCIDCTLYAEMEPSEAIGFVERWQSEEDLRRHLRSDIYRQVLELVELSTESPEIHFYQVVESAGLELVEAVRFGE